MAVPSVWYSYKMERVFRAVLLLNMLLPIPHESLKDFMEVTLSGKRLTEIIKGIGELLRHS